MLRPAGPFPKAELLAGCLVSSAGPGGITGSEAVAKPQGGGAGRPWMCVCAFPKHHLLAHFCREGAPGLPVCPALLRRAHRHCSHTASLLPLLGACPTGPALCGPSVQQGPWRCLGWRSASVTHGSGACPIGQSPWAVNAPRAPPRAPPRPALSTELAGGHGHRGKPQHR